MVTKTTTTPMMKQYQDAKAACGDAILLFRMGDFYELFLEDAKTSAKVLGLTLTSRDKGDNPIPMAGFPHHQLDNYLGKLIQSGFRVAVCEQTEDPRKAKGLVRREVARVVSAGTVTDDALLDPKENNFLAAVVQSSQNDESGLAWIELTTGRFFAARIFQNRLEDELARIQPAECLMAEETSEFVVNLSDSTLVTKRANWSFSYEAAKECLSEHFGIAGLDGFGFSDEDVVAIRAAGAILEYLRETQKSSLSHIDRLVPYRAGSQLEIDQATRRSLELTRTIREGNREGSLLAVLDRTVTAMGSRLLSDWLSSPLTDLKAIDARLDGIEELLGDLALSDDLASTLKSVYDLERLVAKITTGRAGPRDLCFVGLSLQRLPKVKAKLTACSSELLARLGAELDLCPDVCERIDAVLVEECPILPREGGFIRQGFSHELDDLRELAAGGKQWIAQYQADQITSAGIPSLKVGYNKVFGYYIEVTNAHRDKIPDNFIRKQTLKNAERFVTSELKEYEEKVLVADEKAIDLEYDLFLELRETVAVAARRLQSTAKILATLDILVALADLARSRNYCRPVLVDSVSLHIVDGRHPVLDILEPQGSFVPNDTLIEDGEVIQIITGPNMAGKSTYIRQVALLTLMAQMGSYVPARKAEIGVADRIFARVGASDELSRGQSTFMVEMTETARILNTASQRSLVILDEIGRGTSTYDGVSLAWSIIEFLHDGIGCRTLFATHYHELTDLERTLSSVRNLNVTVKEWEDKVVFLHKITPGAADKSYGIHVARLAGVPREVNERAKEILAQLEAEHLDASGRPKIARQRLSSGAGQLQLSLFGYADHPLLEEICAQEINTLTPIEALSLVQSWQTRLQKETQTKPR